MKANVFENEALTYMDGRRVFWERVSKGFNGSWGAYYRRTLQRLVSNVVPQDAIVMEVGCGRGELLSSLNPREGLGVDFVEHTVEQARAKFPLLEFVLADAHDLNLGDRTFEYIVVCDLVNDLWDVQLTLEQLRKYCNRNTRLVFNFHSQLWKFPLKAARALGIATPNLTQNWLTKHDVENLLEVSGFEVLREFEEIIVPLPIPVLGNFANRFLAKLYPFRALAMSNFVVARALDQALPKMPMVSVVVAARNESGHIDELMERIPEMGGGTEIIFVEGNSTDDTYQAIERAIIANPGRRCKLLKQLGKGKGDAVRSGFEAATGEVLMILDADITVPPEDLPRFYDLMVRGKAEFVNGVRLVYPMEDQAMRFFNLLGNKFFAAAFSWLLGQPIRDTLCGTKVLWRDDYRKIVANRSYFGDFDPFGDFDLLFGAARLNLKIMEIPIRYRARRYGETNIQRWRHGLLLLRMVMFAARKIKFVL